MEALRASICLEEARSKWSAERAELLAGAGDAAQQPEVRIQELEGELEERDSRTELTEELLSSRNEREPWGHKKVGRLSGKS